MSLSDNMHFIIHITAHNVCCKWRDYVYRTVGPVVKVIVYSRGGSVGGAEGRRRERDVVGVEGGMGRVYPPPHPTRMSGGAS